MELGTLARLRALVLGRPMAARPDKPLPLFVNLEISRLNRLAFIVVRGQLTIDAARDVAAQLAAAHVPAFARIIDISGMSLDLDTGQARRFAALVRRASDTSSGRVALVVARDHDTLRKRLAEIFEDDTRVAVVRSLQQARAFVHRELTTVFDNQSQAAD